MSTVIPISRCGFLGSVFSAGALVLAAQVLPAKALGTPAAAEGSAEPWYPSVYLGIEPTGTVTIVAHRSEMGTGIRTALPMVAADEIGRRLAAGQDRAGARRSEVRRPEYRRVEIDP